MYIESSGNGCGNSTFESSSVIESGASVESSRNSETPVIIDTGLFFVAEGDVNDPNTRSFSPK